MRLVNEACRQMFAPENLENLGQHGLGDFANAVQLGTTARRLGNMKLQFFSHIACQLGGMQCVLKGKSGTILKTEY